MIQRAKYFFSLLSKFYFIHCQSTKVDILNFRVPYISNKIHNIKQRMYPVTLIHPAHNEIAHK